MPKSVKLLLVENVDTLGIVGDVVNVRVGYARNFLLPRALATTPSDELIASLAAKRANAQKEVAQLRAQREETTKKLTGVEIEMIRAVNDQGILYGAVTQQDVAAALTAKGFAVKPRDVRIPQVIKRVGDFDLHIKLDSDLDSIVKLHVKPDREIETRDGDRPESDKKAESKAGEGKPADGAAVEGKTDGKAEGKGDRKPGGARRERPEGGGDRGERPERAERPDRDSRGRGWQADLDRLAAEDAKRVKGWGSAKPAEGSGDAKGDKGGDKPKKEKAPKKKAE